MGKGAYKKSKTINYLVRMHERKSKQSFVHLLFEYKFCIFATYINIERKNENKGPCKRKNI